MQNSPGKITKKASSRLRQFESIEIPLNSGKKINLLQDLRNTPRTGYLVRAEKTNLQISIPSIFDHINKLAAVMDAFIKTGAYDFDVDILADLCAYHDFSESIIGDIPEFTDEALAGDHYVSPEEKIQMEKKTSGIIARNLDGKLKKQYQDTIEILDNGKGGKFKEDLQFFIFMDKLEAMLTLWQYVFQQREKIGNIKKFIRIMEDFFDYPLKRLSIDDRTYKVAKLLQDRIKFEDYYYQGREVFYEAGYQGQDYTFLLPLIEKLAVAGQSA